MVNGALYVAQVFSFGIYEGFGTFFWYTIIRFYLFFQFYNFSLVASIQQKYQNVRESYSKIEKYITKWQNPFHASLNMTNYF